MASRKEQKERARQERLAAERAAAEKAARTKRMQLGLGGVAAVAAVVAVVIAIAAGAGGKSGTGNPSTPSSAPPGVKLPAQKISDLAAAAKAAGCVTIDPPSSVTTSSANRQHVGVGTKVKYATNPPSYGPHYPAPASDGIYQPSKTPAISYLVHALEHGRVEYQYRPGLPQAEVNQLTALFYEGDGNFAPKQYLLLFQNPTAMPYDVAATAWGHVIGCSHWNTGVIDALRDFRLAYSFKGPETAFVGPE
jgi:hypothetical protein